MNVPAISRVDRLMCAFATDDSDSCVQNRHTSCDDGYQQGNEECRTSNCHKRNDAEREAQEQRARIPHEYTRWVDVRLQEANARTHDHEACQCSARAPSEHRQNADSGCRDGGNARCKSIKTIDEVDDVREGNQIEDGKGIR